MRYNRVFLIQPAYPGSHYYAPTFPVGLGYIAEALKSASIDYRVADMGVHGEYNHLVSEIKNFQPSLIGISMLSSMYLSHYDLAGKLKKSFPVIDIVAGGPHISTFRHQVLKDCPQIDYGVTLEGEHTLIELCRGEKPEEIKGLLFHKNGDIHYTGDRPFIDDLDSIAFPKFEGFEVYDTTAINILSARGCPYACIYCPVKATIGRKLRIRSVESIMGEIEIWYRRGYRRFSFVDDNFTFYKERVHGICDSVIRKELQIEMSCPNGVRADKLDMPLLKKMKKAGFVRIAIGVEAGTDRILKNLKKGERLREITDAIENACNLGYEVALFFLIGSPGETPEDIEKSFSIAEKYEIQDVRFYNLIPFPGTELYEWVYKNDYFVRSPEQYFNGGLHWVNEPIFYTPEMSVEQRKTAFERGNALGRKLRNARRYKNYRNSFRKFGIFSPIVASIASREEIQAKLMRLKFFHRLRVVLKKYGFFSPISF